MTGPDRRSPGAQGPTPADPSDAAVVSPHLPPDPDGGVDDQTDPFIPRITDTALSECHTDPALPRVGAELPDDAAAQGTEVPQRLTDPTGEHSDHELSDHVKAALEDTDVHAVVGRDQVAHAGVGVVDLSAIPDNPTDVSLAIPPPADGPGGAPAEVHHGAASAVETTDAIRALRAEPDSEADTGRQADVVPAVPTDQQDPGPAAVSGWAADVSGEPVGLPPNDPDVIASDPVGLEQHELVFAGVQEEEAQSAWWRRSRVLVPLGVLGLLLVLYAMDLVIAGNDVPRNTVVAGMQLGGLTRDEAVEVLQGQGQAMLAAPRTATAGPVTLEVLPAEAGLALDVPGTVEAATAQPLHPVTRLMSLFADRQVDAVLDVDQPVLDEAMIGYADQVDVKFVEGSIEFEGTTPSVVEPSDGRQLDRGEAAEALQSMVRTGSDELVFPVREHKAQITAVEAGQTLESFVVPALSAPVLLTGSGEAQTDLTIEEIAASLRFGPGDDGSLLAWVDEAGLTSGIGADVRDS